jgi:excisionase family DNA binding protein
MAGFRAGRSSAIARRKEVMTDMRQLPTLIDIAMGREIKTRTDEEYPRLLTLLEVATTLRLSPHTVRSLVRRGKLRPTRICRRLLFTREEISRLLGEAK